MKRTAEVNPRKCIHCLACLTICPKKVFVLEGHNIKINRKQEEKFCKDCENKICMILCPTEAIKIKKI